MVRRLLLFVGAGLPAELRLEVGSCVKILLPRTEPQGLAGSKERRPPGGRKGENRHRECEDFAPRDEATRVSGERGAKGPADLPAKLRLETGSCVKILLPETEPQGFVGSGEQRGGPICRRNCA